MWLTLLHTAPAHAQEQRAAAEAQDAAADRKMLVALHNNLPRSVRPLLGLQNIDDAVAQALSVLDWWDERIAETEPGSRQRAFLEAGKRVALSKMGNSNPQEQQVRPN